VTPNELTNGVINSCFFLLIKDLIRLYAAFNDGMINLLGKNKILFYMGNENLDCFFSRKIF
jgi:hypothetical protein